MSLFGVDPSHLATPNGIMLVALIIMGMFIFFGFQHLNKQSELAKVNRELIEKIAKLENDLGKTTEAYYRTVNSLDQSQQLVILLQEQSKKSNELMLRMYGFNNERSSNS